MGGPRDFDKIRMEMEQELRAGTAVGGIGWWCVAQKTSGQVLGHCGLVKKTVEGRDEIELVYVFASAAWGKGYATESAAALRDHAVGELALGRIIALIDPANRASVRVAEKIGLIFEKETRRPSGKTLHVYSWPSAEREGS